MLLMLSCNDYRNGAFSGRFRSAHFDFGHNFELGLECHYYDVEFKCAETSIDGKPALKIGRKTARTYGSKEWYGNWCWNAYHVALADAATLLNYLRETKGFSPDHGATELWEHWESGRDFTVESLREAYRRSRSDADEFARREAERCAADGVKLI